MSEADRFYAADSRLQMAEAAYERNPGNVDHLIKWGSALVNKSHFCNSEEGVKYVEDAVLKLKEALKLNSEKLDAWWSLGHAYKTHAYFASDLKAATVFFDKAIKCYKKACDEAPLNNLYRRSLESASKDRDLHMERCRQGIQTASSASGSKTSKKREKCVFLGWVILSVGVIAWAELARRKNLM